MAAGPNDLVTMAQAYAWLGIPPGSDDANLQFAISAYSQLISSWCSRNFVSAAYTEFYDGHGGSRLMLKNWPVTAVAALGVDAQAIAAAPDSLSAGYLFSDRSVVLSNGQPFYRGLQNITITYTAGYTTIPYDLQMACLEWMKSTYLWRTEQAGITSRRAGDTEEKYSSPVTLLLGEAAAMPVTVYAVLSQYRNNLPV